MTDGTNTGNWNDPPWHPITNPMTLKTLGKLAEEAGELVQALGRCIIQGLNSENPDNNKSNKVWLREEIADVLANIELVEELLDLPRMTARIERKKPLLKAWHEEA